MWHVIASSSPRSTLQLVSPPFRITSSHSSMSRWYAETRRPPRYVYSNPRLTKYSAVAEVTQKVKVLAGPKLKLKAKSKQRPNELKLKASCGELPCEAKVSGKAKLPREGRKTKSYKLKTKTVSLNEGKTKSVKLKFEKQKKSVRKIDKLLNKDKKARKRNKLTVKVKATGPAGGTDMGKAKIKLKG